MTSLIQDLQYGLRSLIKSPGFTAVAVLTLALGVGANAAIFSVLRAVVLRDLPYHDADRIAVMWTKNIRQNLPDGSSYLNFRDWKEQSKHVRADGSLLSAGIHARHALGRSGSPNGSMSGRSGRASSSSWARHRSLGRTFEAGDFTAATRTVIISHSLWQQRFGADRSVIGRSIQLSDRTVEVVGVMPPGFELPTADVQLWQPLFFGPQWQDERSPRPPMRSIVLGRLRPSATIASARAEMDAIAARLRDQYPAIERRLRRDRPTR